MATARRENEDDGVADRDVGDAGADLCDDARALMADDHRQRPRPHALDRREIGMAQPRRLDLDQHLAGARPFEVECLDPQRLALRVGARQALLIKDGASHFHGFLLLPTSLRAR